MKVMLRKLVSEKALNEKMKQILETLIPKKYANR